MSKLLDSDRVHDHWSYCCWAWALACAWACLTGDNEVKRMQVRKRWEARAENCRRYHQ